MERMLKGFIVAIMALFSVSLFAQDVHFSQYYAAPQALNPAFTGVFNGKIRSNLNYRNQWGGFSATGAAFQTYATSVDMRISNIALKRNFLGVGLSMYNDRAGDAGLYTQNIAFSNSVGINFSKKKVENLVILGYQFGVLIRGLNYDGLTFGSQYVNDALDVTAPTGERRFDEFRFGYDLGLGGLWVSKPMELLSFYLGASVFHLNQPNQSFFKTGDDPLPMRISIHGGAQYTFGRMVDLVPIMKFEHQGLSNEMLIGMNFMFSDMGIKKDPRKPMYYIGGMARLGDAFIVTTGVKVKSMKIGLSYDVNLSQLTQGSRFKGGPEISFEFVGDIGRRKTNFTIAAPRI
jgi:type IX secretion system PorP/SprF family membrane protein